MPHKLLVIDDSSDVLSLYRHALESDELQVETACSAREALACLEADTLANSLPDVILLDLYMPDMNGAEFMQALKARPIWRGIRVLLVSGIDDLRARAVALGTDGSVSKPVDLDTLSSSIEALLN